VSDSLDELRKQRDLQRERLEWLDREIAAQEGMLREEAEGERPAEARPQESRSADQILDEFRQSPAQIHKLTTFGCIVYFAAAMGILAVLAATFYLYVRSGQARH
jgi:hypothetical protein